jgi:hypothetical protein
MKDARNAGTTNGRNYATAVVTAGQHERETWG